jgi:hypothetical protein
MHWMAAAQTLASLLATFNIEKTTGSQLPAPPPDSPESPHDTIVNAALASSVKRIVIDSGCDLNIIALLSSTVRPSVDHMLVAKGEDPDLAPARIVEGKHHADMELVHAAGA